MLVLNETTKEIKVKNLNPKVSFIAYNIPYGNTGTYVRFPEGDGANGITYKNENDMYFILWDDNTVVAFDQDAVWIESHGYGYEPRCKSFNGLLGTYMSPASGYTICEPLAGQTEIPYVELTGVQTSLEFNTMWVDHIGTTVITKVEGESSGIITDDTTIVSAPGLYTRRVVETASILNTSGVQTEIDIYFADNGNESSIAHVTLENGDNWTLSGTFDSTGALKQS